eukprot:jgi/Picre1/32913/NNA_008242.t1
MNSARALTLFALALLLRVGCMGFSKTCPIGDGVCLCEAYSYKLEDGKTLAALADVTSKCESYYSCATDGSYESCPSGFIMSESQQRCMKAETAVCEGRIYGQRQALNASKIWELATEIVTTNNGPQYVGYFQTWSEMNTTDPYMTQMANLPPYVTQVMISFFKPDSTYAGGLTFEGTGLQFKSSPSVMRDAIRILKERNPETRVFLSVGGATYDNWTGLNAAAAALFVEEFGLDGIDIDFEPRDLHNALPEDKQLTAAVFNVGAFGEGIFADALPQGGYTGVSINMLRTVGDLLDSLNIMAYDAGTTYNPKEAFAAYASLYSGPMTLGMQVAFESWGDNVISMRQVVELSNWVKGIGGSGMMLWSLQKPADEGPSAQQISQEVCIIFGLQDCMQPLFPRAPAPPPLDPMFPSPPPPPPSIAPASPPPPPPFVFPSPPPPQPRVCTYKSTVRIRTTGCKGNKYLTYSRKKCSTFRVTLQSYKAIEKDWKQSYWSLNGVSRSNMPIRAAYRSSKCNRDRRFLALAEREGQYLRLSVDSWEWRIIPVSDSSCNRVQLYNPNIFRYLSMDSTCSGFRYTRGSGSTFEFRPTV